MILLKAFQRLGYFPNPQEIPGAVISHIRAVMRFPDDLVPDIVSRTMYRYHAAIRAHLEIKSEGKYIRHVAAKAIYTAVQVMDTPADLINVAIETLVKEHCELPAFRTLTPRSSIWRRRLVRSMRPTSGISRRPNVSPSWSA